MKKILLEPFEALGIVWKFKNDFQKARLKLTGLYILILFVILNLFTVSLFWILKKEEIIHIQKLQNIWHKEEIFFPNQKITIIELKQDKPQIKSKEIIDLQHVFLEIIKKRILIIEFLLLALAGGLSYFLSGKTLRPIQEKNEQQKQFLADVSHELKNPLSALKMTLDVVKNQKEWKQGEINDVLSDIDTEIKRLSTITQDLILLEKSNKVNFKEKVKLNNIIENIIEKCRYFAKKKNIKINTYLEKCIIYAEKKDVEKLVFNLLHNSIKFSYLNGKIEIKLLSNGEFIIRDFGIGVSKEDLPKIFNRFYKADNARTFNEENGSGLGLSIVKKICDKNHWKINIKTNLEKGMTFFCKFNTK